MFINLLDHSKNNNFLKLSSISLNVPMHLSFQSSSELQTSETLRENREATKYNKNTTEMVLVSIIHNELELL